MVNGADHAADIAKVARKFETMLLNTKRQPWSPCVRMRPFAAGGFFQFAVALLLMGISAAWASPPPALRGTWRVVQVAVDSKDQPHWLYYPDDPRLLGRGLTISGSKITFGDGSPACLAPAFDAGPAESLGQLVGDSYRRPPAYERPPAPSLRDFDLSLRNRQVSLWQVDCTPNEGQWTDRWLVFAGGRLLVGEHGGGYILVLDRVGPDEPVHASFDCTRAQNAAERSICQSPGLAAHDRSVAVAYRRALKQAGDAATALRKAQRKWLAKRDACGCDAACLVSVIRRRVDQLVRLW